VAVKRGNGLASAQLAFAVDSGISLNNMSHHHHHRDLDDHSRSSEHKHDYAKANAEHFDKESKNQEMIKAGTELAQMSAPYILKHSKFDKETTEVLDFAAGWGASVLEFQGFRMYLILCANRLGVQANYTICKVHPWS